MPASSAWNCSACTMSNYSVYFLLQTLDLGLNCSVYSLMLGDLTYEDYYTDAWTSNFSQFLPAYYVTNCSIPNLLSQIESQNISSSDILAWVSAYKSNPYNGADNGDSFVALLYMLSGLCVSGWMLLLLFVLLPRHKRKPLLTQLAMLIFLAYLLALFTLICSVARTEYYEGNLDMIKLLSIAADRDYTIVSIILALVTHLAYLQLLLKMSKNAWKTINTVIISALIVAIIVCSSLAIANAREPIYFYLKICAPFRNVTTSLHIVFVGWFGWALAYYTIYGTKTSPKQVLYSYKLLPLALLTWANILLNIVISILMVSYWRDNWLLKAWVSFVPSLLDMYTLTTSWEWFYSIHHLELKLELVDMLGRRISLDDVLDFNNDANVKLAAFRGRFSSLLDPFLGRKKAKNRQLQNETSLSNSSLSSNREIALTADSSSDLGRVVDSQNDGESLYEVRYSGSEIWNLDDDIDGDEVAEPHANEANELRARELQVCAGSPPAPPMAGSSTAVHYNSEGNRDSARLNLGGHNADHPPPFNPLPGFSAEDYWDDK